MSKLDMSREELRILRLLAKGTMHLTEGAAGMLLTREDGTATRADMQALHRLEGQGAVSCTDGALSLTEVGRRASRSALSEQAPAGRPLRDLDTARVEMDGAWHEVTVNHEESPLTALARRRDRDGRSFLSARELRAGERLRRDYSKGQIMRRTGIDWSAAGAAGSSGRRGPGNSVAELTDLALAARQRVEYALRAVDPEFAGVLVDVCCFLKGLETVERERGWPVRSAKVVLRSGLRALARHYEPEKTSAAGRPILHWGAEGYRPRL